MRPMRQKGMQMVKLVAAVAVLVMLWAQGALAQAVETPLQRAMQANPDRFEAAMLDLVAGFGGPSGLTRDGIAEHVALERASARAAAMRRLLAMDLDADGTVTRDELQDAQRAASATSRGRMERQFAAADAEGDGRVTAAEIAADGKAAAMRALGEDEEALLMSVLTLDADGDGALRTDELSAAMTRVDDAT
jgi:Ca2+-binding EF-hand superfamily protein